MWKSYKVFTSGCYRLLMLLVFPICYIAANTVLSALCGWEIHMEIFLSMCLAPVEIMADYWFLSGSCSKESPELILLQCSAEGPSVIRKAATADALRRFFGMAGINLVCWAAVEIGAWLSGRPGGPAAASAVYALLTAFFFYLISTIGIIIGRYFGLFHIQVGISSVVLFPFVIVFVFLVSNVPIETFVSLGNVQNASIAAGIILLLSIAAGAVSVWNVIRKVRKSYYDT